MVQNGPNLGQKMAKTLLVGRSSRKNDFEDNDQDFGCSKIFIGPNRGKHSPQMQRLAMLSKCFISFAQNVARSLENNFEDNDRDFSCGNICIGPNSGKKGEKSVQKYNFWLNYPNALFLLVEIWQDLLENDFQEYFFLSNIGRFAFLTLGKFLTL